MWSRWRPLGLGLGGLGIAGLPTPIRAVLFSSMLRELPEDRRLDPGFKTADLLYISGMILAFTPVVGLPLLLAATIARYWYARTSLGTSGA